MDNRKCINSDYYGKYLREKFKRDNKFTKLQNKILQRQAECQKQQIERQQPQPNRQKIKRSLNDRANNLNNEELENEKRWQINQKHLSKRQVKPETDETNLNGHVDYDLLNEIDNSLVVAKGFLYGKGN
jgi:hypothetical protein